jgi:hypothetical protein
MAEAISNVPPDMEDLEVIREEFAIEAEVKAEAEANRKEKMEVIKRARKDAAAQRAATATGTEIPAAGSA